MCSEALHKQKPHIYISSDRDFDFFYLYRNSSDTAQPEKAMKIIFMKTAFHSFWKATKCLCNVIERGQPRISKLNCSKTDSRAVSVCSSECRQATTVNMNNKFSISYNTKIS